MDSVTVAGNSWLLIPIGAYLVFALVLFALARRIALLDRVEVPLHIVALGLCVQLSLPLMPPHWAQFLAPYGKAMLAFGCLVLIIVVVEAFSVGYVMVHLRGRHIPPILRRFILLALYFLVATIILRTYLDLDVTSLIATSAVVSFVVGLASQDLLGSVLAGMVIGIERPVGLDDWITIDGMEGQIVDITWRRAEIRTRDGDIMVLPNSRLMKSTITNHSRPTADHRLTLTVNVHYRHPPTMVKEAILAAAVLCSRVLARPAPSVYLYDFEDSSITYRLNAWIGDFGDIEQVRDEIKTYIWYQFRRRDIEIPYPMRTLHRERKEAPGQCSDPGRVERLVPLLSKAEIFRGIPPEALAEQARRMQLMTYGAGETLFWENQAGRNMYMLVSGRAKVLKRRPGGGDQEMAVLGPGDICGEMSLLLDQPRMATVHLSADSQIIGIGPDVFKELAGRYPEFLQNLSLLVERRRHENAQLRALLQEADGQTPEGRIKTVLGMICSALKL